MRVLLTGASGFIGQHVLRALIANGVDTVTLGRQRPPALPQTHQHIAFDLLQQSDIGNMLVLANATHLLHCAWYAEHGAFWTSPLNTRWADASIRLVEGFCHHGGQRVVGAGTCAEYDWSHGWLREEHTPLVPATLYGASKDATRRITELICQQAGVAFAWGRIFSPYGTGENSARLVPLLTNALRGEVPAQGINAACYRDFLHVTDVASGLLALLQDGAQGAYNISAGQPTSLANLAELLAALLHKDPGALLSLPPQRRDPVILLAGDNQRLRSLGWQPQLDLAAGLAAYLADR